MTVGTSEQYRDALVKMLPPGSYWESLIAEKDSDISLILSGMAEETREFRIRMARLLDEAFPMTAEETLECWERVRLGKTYDGYPTSFRRAMIMRCADFSSVYEKARAFGTVISLEFPFRCGCFGSFRCGRQRLGAQNTLSVVTVSVTGGENLDDGGKVLFESVIASCLLANQIVSFRYTFHADRTFADIGELSHAVKKSLVVERPYPPARFGRASFGRTRISGLYLPDIALVRIEGCQPTWRRNDIEAEVTRLLRYAKVLFVYGSESFARLPAECRDFGNLAELSEFTGIDLREFRPYKMAVFGRGRCGRRLSDSGIKFISMGGYGIGYRRTDIENAVLGFCRGHDRIYFLYKEEIVYGYVS